MNDTHHTIRIFQYRLSPTPAQAKLMLLVLELCRNWYNMCLAERNWAWEQNKRSVTKGEQQKTAVHYRRTFPQAQVVFSQTLQSVCDDLDKAFQSFFRRLSLGEKAGYPRFKSKYRFHSFMFKQFGKGAKLDGKRLKLFGIGRVRVRWHRCIEGDIKTVRIVHKAGKWYVCFACEVAAQPLPPCDNAIGIDVGITALVTTSNGDKVEHPALYRRSQVELRRKQRKLARAKIGSNNRQKALHSVQRLQEKVAYQRKDFLHKLSYKLVIENDTIVLEDLYVANMARNRHLSKSIMDSGWATFRSYLTYKAESARRQIAFVNPAYTSKCCSQCGAIFEDFDLSTRWVECACGLSLDRDHNAARNILARSGLDESVQRNVAPLPVAQAIGKRKRAVEATRF